MPSSAENIDSSSFETPQMSDGEFETLKKIIYRASGLQLERSKMNLVSSRLSRRLRARGIDSWKEYIALLQSSDATELRECTNVMTTNKTSFFRERKHFDFLKNVYFPEVLARGDREVFVWIGASSTGQEVYTLAMLINEFCRIGQKNFQGRILATDIDTNVLRVASEGIYDGSLVEKDLEPDFIRRYFLAGSGEFSGSYRFNPEFATNIKFRYHNICDTSERIAVQFDVIFLRNLLIYFNSEMVDTVITHMVSQLKIGGLLILGHSESIIDMKWLLERVEHSVYKRID